MISIRNVSKRFGPVLALDAVSLDLRPGERVAVIGPNGSGKTTLLRAVLGLLKVEGRIEVFGADVARASGDALRSLAYMPQVAPPLEAPVGELVRAACVLRCRTVDQVKQKATVLGLSLDAIAKVRVRDLSGGMKQKLLAALALAAEAPVLICDEPTANLDATSRAAFFEEVLARPPTGILVLCSHRVDEVRHLVDRVIEMREGKVVRDEPLSAMLAALRSFRVEVSFRNPELGDAQAPLLAARGLRRLGPGRFAGIFQAAEKVEVVSALLSSWRGELLDLSVLDAEVVETGRAPQLWSVE